MRLRFHAFIFCFGFAFGQVDTDLQSAVDMFFVDASHVPSNPQGAGKMLMEFKRQMKLLDQSVKDQMKAAPEWKKQNGATELEFNNYKKQIVEFSMRESVDIARRLRDPAMARLVADANRGLDPAAKIQLAGGTGPKGSSYRGGFGDVDLQGNSNAIDRFKKLFDQASIPEKTGNKPGYLAYEDIDITLHKMGRLGPIGSSALQGQVNMDAGSKETYVSSAMSKDQVGVEAVLVQDHMKKALQGARLSPSKLIESPDALQSFAKGTKKCIDTAGLNYIEMGQILKDAGYSGSLTSFRQKLEMLKSDGYDRAPQELGLDAEGMRVFKKAALSMISAADQKTWKQAQNAMQNERLQIAELRKSKDPSKLEEANRRHAELEDSTMRLNETFSANKKRFHWLGDRDKIKTLLTAPHTQKMRFIAYMSSAPNGRRMGLTFLMEQARKDPAAARQIMEELPPHVKARMREHPDYAAFEAELAKTATSAWRSEIHLPAFAASCKLQIDRINATINQSIQNCAYARGFSKGMSYYGKLSEVQSYYQAWERGGPEEMIVDIIRKRIPFMTTVEYAMMDNYWMAGWDVVCTVLPPVGLLSAASNIGMTIGSTGVDYLYEYELLDFEEELYRTAKFELTGVTSLEDAKLGKWKLISVQPETRVFTRQQLLDGWLSVPPGASILITKADPVLAAINEMMKHPSVGKKLLYGRDGQGGYWKQYLDRKAQVFKWWAQQAISNLELRKTTQDAWVRGQLPVLYAQLIQIAKSLSIENEINQALDTEMGSGFFDPLRQWIKDVTFRDEYVQGTAQSTFREEAAAKAVIQYLEVYREVLDARDRAEKHAGLNPKTDASIRILTGTTSLFVNLVEDRKSSRTWFSLPLLKKTEIRSQMSSIKARYLDQTGLSSDYDQKSLQKLLTHAVWLDAWTHAIRVSQDKKTASEDFGISRRAYHRLAFDDVLKDYEAYYANLAAGSMEFHVVEKLPGFASGQPIQNAQIIITDSSGAQLKVPQTGEGTFLLKRALPGMYRYTAKAKGYFSLTGKEEANGFVSLEMTNPAITETIEMEPIPGVAAIELEDDLGAGIPQAPGMLAGSGRPPKAFKADDSGVVLLTDVLAGTYQIETFALGFKSPVPTPELVLDPIDPKRNSPQPIQIRLLPFLSNLKVQIQDDRDLPVEGTLVRVGSMEMFSDSNGTAIFENVRPSKELKIQAVKDGLLTATKTIDLRPTAEGTTLTQTLVMKGGVTLSVRVLDKETGQPLEGADVDVSSISSHGTVETDSKGESRITGLAPDFSYVSVSGRQGYLDISNIEVDLRNPGPKAIVVKEIQLQKGIEVVLVIRGENGELVPGAYAQMDNGPQWFVPTGRVVVAPVKNGDHVFHVSAQGYSERSLTFSVGSDTEPKVTLFADLLPGMTILGEVRDEGGVLFRESATQLRLMREGTQLALGIGPRFLFSDLQPGMYSLVASAMGYESQTTPSVRLSVLPDEKTLTAILLTTGLLTVIVKAHDGSQSLLPPDVLVELTGTGIHFRKAGAVARFPSLAIGSYTVQATAAGFSSDSRKVSIASTRDGMIQQITLNLQKEGPKEPDKQEAKEFIKEEKSPFVNSSYIVEEPKTATPEQDNGILGTFNFGKGRYQEIYVYSGGGPLPSSYVRKSYFWKGSDWKLSSTKYFDIEPVKYTFTALKDGVVSFKTANTKPDELYYYSAGASGSGSFTKYFPVVSALLFKARDNPGHKALYQKMENDRYKLRVISHLFLIGTQAEKVKLNVWGNTTDWITVSKGDTVVIEITPFLVDGNGFEDGKHDDSIYIRQWHCPPHSGELLFVAKYLED